MLVFHRAMIQLIQAALPHSFDMKRPSNKRIIFILQKRIENKKHNNPIQKSKFQQLDLRHSFQQVSVYLVNGDQATKQIGLRLSLNYLNALAIISNIIIQMKKSKLSLKDFIDGRIPIETLKVIENRYHLKNIYLGQGSYGQVYACWDTVSKQVLAAKTISKVAMLAKINNCRSRIKAKDFYVKSLQNEVFLMRDFDNENVLKFYSYSETNTHLYYYLEYCNQGSLADLIQKQIKFDIEKALPLMRQIVKGCSYLHQKNICHRDLKPQNILLHNGVPKICDFGFAVKLSDDNCITSQFSVGSSQYMAPQIYAKKKCGLKCDVWSLGITFYEMIYGRCPWGNPENSKQLQQKQKQLIVLPGDVFVPNWLKMILQKMLTFEQQLRPSMRELSSLFNL